MEDQDVILPDDFEDTPTEEVSADEDSLELDAEETTDTEDTKPVEDVTEQTEPEQQAKIKIIYNKEEKEIDLEEAKLLAQKGMNYEKAIERAKQEAAQQAKDAVIAEMGMVDYEGQPITTESRYREVLQEKEIRDKYKDLDPELRKELIENRRFREQFQAQQQQQEQQIKQQQQFDEFIQSFPNVDPSTIKPETWEKVNAGIPLKYAYMEQERAELLTRTKVVEQNQKNKQRAPVTSVSAHGTGDTLSSDPFLEGFDS